MSPQLFVIFMLTLVGEMVSSSDLESLTKASCEFSQKLYQQVALNKENVVYSPLSIHLALTLTLYGARGTTATQMKDTLSLAQLGQSVHRTYHDLIVQMSSARDVELYTGNALFLNPNFDIEYDFIREARDNYFSLASNFDLDAPGGPEEYINLFVNEKTRGIIKEILPPGIIHHNTALVIINTLIFNGTWATQFNKEWTTPQRFYKRYRFSSLVEMMRHDMDVYLKIDEEQGIDILQLPFKNTRFGLYIVLPKEVNDIVKLESLLQSPSAAEWFNDLKLTRVDVRIPKFKIETELPLNRPLQNLGMTNAFSRRLADFPGISPTGGIYINNVLHKSVIKVQETGTVAAAATSTVDVHLMMPPPVQYTFTADHPFLFFLRDNETKQILFQGKFSG